MVAKEGLGGGSTTLFSVFFVFFFPKTGSYPFTYLVKLTKSKFIQILKFWFSALLFYSIIALNIISPELKSVPRCWAFGNETHWVRFAIKTKRICFQGFMSLPSTTPGQFTGTTAKPKVSESEQAGEARQGRTETGMADTPQHSPLSEWIQ